MTFTVEIYPVGSGFGYNILGDGSVIIHQDFDPEAAGDVPMDHDRATAMSGVVVARLMSA